MILCKGLNWDNDCLRWKRKNRRSEAVVVVVVVCCCCCCCCRRDVLLLIERGAKKFDDARVPDSES